MQARLREIGGFPVRIRESILPIVVSGLVGLVVLKWEWLANASGLEVHVNRGNSMVTFEYAVGLVATFLLGYAFPSWPIACAISFMLTPTLITHSIYISQHGVPNLWPVELMFLAALTVPYIGLAYGGAYLRKRWSKSQATPENPTGPMT
jgi:hypothetical protein